MSVTVVIPLYNKAATVERTLQSLVSQTFAEWEAIIVDDGSTDESVDRAAACTDPRIRVIRQPNAGPGAARNRGIAEARGGIVAFLDADDYWQPGYLQLAVDLLTANPAAASVSFAWFDDPGGTSSVPLWQSRGLRTGLFQVTAETPVPLVYDGLIFMHPCATVARTSVVRRFGGFKTGCFYGEDSFLWIKVLLNEPVYFALEPMVHLDHGASALSYNLRGARPVEPFLQNPGEVRQCCPVGLQDKLGQLFAMRAMKTACMLGWWGQWRQAGQLRRRFAHPKASRLPWYWPSLMASTPVGAVTGTVARLVQWIQLQRRRAPTAS